MLIFVGCARDPEYVGHDDFKGPFQPRFYGIMCLLKAPVNQHRVGGEVIRGEIHLSLI